MRKTRLTEELLVDLFVGKRINESHMQNVFWQNGNGYGEYANCIECICSCVDYLENDRIVKQFAVTAKLIDYWLVNGIDFRIYIWADGTIRSLSLFKYKETYSGHGRPQGHELKCSEQEIRIARRILEFVTQEGQ